MLSITTIESSTTLTIATIKPEMVKIFKLTSIAYKMAVAARRQIGKDSAIINVERKFLKNNNTQVTEKTMPNNPSLTKPLNVELISFP